jgi:hypothetical protein
MAYEGSEAWSQSGELPASAFHRSDADAAPDGTPWWQIKLCGENGDGKQLTPFSNRPSSLIIMAGTGALRRSFGGRPQGPFAGTNYDWLLPPKNFTLNAA